MLPSEAALLSSLALTPSMDARRQEREAVTSDIRAGFSFLHFWLFLLRLTQTQVISGKVNTINSASTKIYLIMLLVFSFRYFANFRVT